MALNNESIVGQDLVAWVMLGIVHVPRSEVGSACSCMHSCQHQLLMLLHYVPDMTLWHIMCHTVRYGEHAFACIFGDVTPICCDGTAYVRVKCCSNKGGCRLGPVRHLVQHHFHATILVFWYSVYSMMLRGHQISCNLFTACTAHGCICVVDVCK